MLDTIIEANDEFEVVGMDGPSINELGAIVWLSAEDAESAIQSAYRKRARTIHPDRVPHELKEKAQKAFHALSEAIVGVHVCVAL